VGGGQGSPSPGIPPATLEPQGQVNRAHPGIVALIMAIGHALVAQESPSPSILCSLSERSSYSPTPRRSAQLTTLGVAAGFPLQAEPAAF
jgi:hypothetical protein